MLHKIQKKKKSACSMPGTVLEARNKLCTEQTKVSSLWGAYILVGRLYSRIKRQKLFSQYIA